MLPQSLRSQADQKALGLEAVVLEAEDEVAVEVADEEVISENTILEIPTRKKVHPGFAKFVSVTMGPEKTFSVLKNPNSN